MDAFVNIDDRELLKYDSKEGIKAETIKSFTKVQPVNLVASVNNSMENKHLSGQVDFGSYKNFAGMLAEEEKKTAKKVAKKDIQQKQEQEQTSIQKMNYYNHNAKEIYFYMTMATTDMKC